VAGLTLPWVAKERLKSPRARLFVALELPEDVREAIVAWQGGLEDPALRVVPPSNLHLTLVFLGWQAERDLERIRRASFEVRAAAPRVELAPEPVQRPPRGRPRLFAFELASDEVVRLQAEVEASLVRARFHKPEKRPFWPHLTVARVKPEGRGSKKPARVEAPPGPLPERMFFRPTRLVLFRSHLRRAGAEYEPMAELELPTAETTER